MDDILGKVFAELLVVFPSYVLQLRPFEDVDGEKLGPAPLLQTGTVQISSVENTLAMDTAISRLRFLCLPSF